MYYVVIRNNETGEVRIHKENVNTWEEGSLWWWEEGNGSCDCNRFLYFMRSNNEDMEHVPIPDCGDRLFSILSIIFEDGTNIITKHNST